MLQRLTAVLGVLLMMSGCDGPQAPTAPLRVDTPEELAKQNQEFPRGIKEVTEGVWVAVGYGLANSVLLEAPDGLIVIDTMSTLEEGRAVATEFRRLSDKPLAAIIYTHNHADHVFGAQAFVDVLAREGMQVELFAHALTETLVNRVVTEYRPIVSRRSFRMFGTALDDEAFVNNGLGPRLQIDENSTFGFLSPTRTFSEALQVEVAGESLQLVHAPGETADALFVWVPRHRMLAVGDNLYKAFPNLYTIRGTPYRSPKQWANSLDKMRGYGAELLVPSHTLPLAGRARIRQVLTDYRDGIRFVHDQTVRYINQGLTPDEIVERVRLPAHLRASPYLREFYGKVEWSVRSIFAGNLGWFDGNSATLHPLAPGQEAARIAALAGGEGKLQAALEKAEQAGDWQWTLQLADYLLRLQPDNPAAREARVTALTRLGEREANPNARHYYLTQALEVRDGLQLKVLNTGSDEMLRRIPLASLFDAMAVNLRAEEALDVDTRASFHFPDTGEQWTLRVRRGVAEYYPMADADSDIVVKVDALVWKKVLSRQRNAVAALATDFEYEKGGRVALAKFLKLFEAEE